MALISSALEWVCGVRGRCREIGRRRGACEGSLRALTPPSWLSSRHQQVASKDTAGRGRGSAKHTAPCAAQEGGRAPQGLAAGAHSVPTAEALIPSLMIGAQRSKEYYK